MKYWELMEYLGLGPSAHSFIDGKRFYFKRDLPEFLEGTSPLPDGEGGSEEERIMLALRLSKGVKLELTESLEKKCRLLSQNKLLNINYQSFSLTDQGMLLSNSIITEILECIK